MIIREENIRGNGVKNSKKKSTLRELQTDFFECKFEIQLKGLIGYLSIAIYLILLHRIIFVHFIISHL